MAYVGKLACANSYNSDMCIVDASTCFVLRNQKLQQLHVDMQLLHTTLALLLSMYCKGVMLTHCTVVHAYMLYAML
jgi:hypothetical protein